MVQVSWQVKAEALRYEYHGQLVESEVTSQIEYEMVLIVLVLT